MEIRILVVDDEESITESLKRDLEESDNNFTVTCENYGYDALNHIKRGTVDLLLTDIGMPDMNGHELYEMTKSLNKDLPVIMMTGFGYDPNHAVVEARKSGLKDIIFKPFDLDKLINLILARVKKD
ncbi:MAG: response regulator [Candidatus Cloacimonadota bacterium]|nr:MAG: response regulator [Candidatus Cloacimonadota bacterium]